MPRLEQMLQDRTDNSILEIGAMLNSSCGMSVEDNCSSYGGGYPKMVRDVPPQYGQIASGVTDTAQSLFSDFSRGTQTVSDAVERDAAKSSSF